MSSPILADTTKKHLISMRCFLVLEKRVSNEVSYMQLEGAELIPTGSPVRETMLLEMYGGTKGIVEGRHVFFPQSSARSKGSFLPS